MMEPSFVNCWITVNNGKNSCINTYEIQGEYRLNTLMSLKVFRGEHNAPLEYKNATFLTVAMTLK